MYCKFCGSQDLREIPVVRETKDETKKEFIGSIPHFRGRFQKTENDGLQYSINEICCQMCLNYGVQTNNQPLEVEILNGDKQIIIIPEILINILKDAKNSVTDIENGIRLVKSNLIKSYNIFVSNGGTNRCKNYRVGEKIIVSFVHVNPFPCWIIIDFVNRTKYFRLCYGGNDIHCR